MKILYYSPHPFLNLSSPSGYGTHIREMINAFRETGHVVESLIMGGEVIVNNDLSIKIKKNPIKKFIPSILWETIKDLRLIFHDRKAQRLLCQKVIDYKPDVIYERGYYMTISGIRIAKKFNLCHILEMNAPFPEERKSMEGLSLLGFLAKRREHIQIKETSHLVVVSSALKSYFKKKFGDYLTNIMIMPNAINPKQ